MTKKEAVAKWFDQYEADSWALAYEMFCAPELANNETKAVNACVKFLEKQGFSCVTGMAAGEKTAFKATWGKGKPVIGFLAEYDALPDLGQEPCADPKPIPGPGHGCGHHLLGGGAIAAAAAMKYALEQTGSSGTVVCYGTPSEEIMHGKIEMIKNGQFRDLDIAITWHPDQTITLGMNSWQSIDIMRIKYHGVTAHAAGAPWQGRSALDAAELTNVAAQYLREHVPDGVRFHHVYLSAGTKPNIVPNYAELNYFVRGKSRVLVDEITDRILNCAKGAAIMTDTKVEWEFDSRGWETLNNFTLSQLMEKCMREVGAPKYTKDELAFAEKLAKNYDPKMKAHMVTEIPKTEDKVNYIGGSSDFSDVSWVVPSICITNPITPQGMPSHHWTFTAAGGSSLGRKGMEFAARSMALAGVELVDEPALIEKATAEYNERRGGRVYKHFSER